MRILLLDTSAIIQGYSPSNSSILFTVNEVLEEVKGNLTRLRIESMIKTNNLVILEPKKRFLTCIDRVSKDLGEKNVLSIADKKILALGLQLMDEGYDPIIISDDYSIQNLSTYMGLKCKGLATVGIKKVLGWTIYCQGCKNKFDEMPYDKNCSICGTPLKRKPTRSM
jgi:UPF0271 protein